MKHYDCERVSYFVHIGSVRIRDTTVLRVHQLITGAPAATIARQAPQPITRALQATTAPQPQARITRAQLANTPQDVRTGQSFVANKL